ncbi:hypothetical protein VSS74_06020 [Conexibacter stalactiti]|uniref:DUF4185 domain-containing protein n=1 Tax=Conexibacter stalactiti TaxID=1940611 RepID=A0ABU4HKN1_9ACTN|nr:hypothetical protein [Conexibacter stalactiti]MDW5593881.1 hypothetical protein [Conexibacter stalactiti]MEC5034523.1 hypothetical protein [Conexibacter stalactiti]
MLHLLRSATTGAARRRRVAAAAAVLGAGALALAPAVAGAAPVCTGVTSPSVTGVTTNTGLSSMFTRYGNGGTGWTGADSTYSARLPSGNDVWIFSDTFMPPITAPTRPTTAPLINNTLVPQSGSTLSTIQGGTTSSPAAKFRPATATHWYWMGGGSVSGSNLEIPMTEWRKIGPSAWDIEWQANALARLPVSNLRATPTITALPSATRIHWAAWTLREGTTTYVYGVEDLGASGGSKWLHIAKVTGSLANTWSYYRGGDPALPASWSATESDSIRVLEHVSNEHSVHRLRSGLYMLTTMDTSLAFNNEIVAYFSCSPVGPFVARTSLYRAPEAGPFGSYGDGDVYAYNAHAHPQLSSSTNVVVTYNVNSLDATIGGDLYRDVSIYRPRFINVGLTP